jgi:RNA polymerase sigma-70 factor (ECF subfamily)
MNPPESVRDTGSTGGVLDPERWIEEHGDYLFHYAISRLRDPQRAEDLVQEALLAAWKGSERYRGGSTERTWLTGILRNKILDHFRKASRGLIRHILQSLEKADLVSAVDAATGGRRLSSEGGKIPGSECGRRKSVPGSRELSTPSEQGRGFSRL